MDEVFDQCMKHELMQQSSWQSLAESDAEQVKQLQEAASAAVKKSAEDMKKMQAEQVASVRTIMDGYFAQLEEHKKRTHQDTAAKKQKTESPTGEEQGHCTDALSSAAAVPAVAGEKMEMDAHPDTLAQQQGQQVPDDKDDVRRNRLLESVKAAAASAVQKQESEGGGATSA